MDTVLNLKEMAVLLEGHANELKWQVRSEIIAGPKEMMETLRQINNLAYMMQRKLAKAMD